MHVAYIHTYLLNRYAAFRKALGAFTELVLWPIRGACVGSSTVKAGRPGDCNDHGHQRVVAG
jgi:hypothetical protein